MNTNYNVDYFIKKFEAIPESKWCTAWISRDDKHCASGHCGITNYYDLNPEVKGLIELFKKLKLTLKTWVCPLSSEVKQIVYVNDSSSLEYDQHTPKQRILAALNDIKKMQETKKHVDITGELAILPVDETSDTLQNLVLNN